MKVDFIFQNNRADEIEDQGSMTLGLLSYENTSGDRNPQCISYSEKQIEEFDPVFRAARACGLLANIILGPSTLFLACMSCLSVRYSAVTFLGGTVLLGGFLQGLTFLVYLSAFSCEDCRPHFGSSLALLGTAAAITCGAVICHIPAARQDEYADKDTDDFSDIERFDRPPTPRFLPTGKTGLSSSTGASEEDEGEFEEIVIPKTWRVKDSEVVLVLPDGSKQVIEPVISQSNCGAMCFG